MAQPNKTSNAEKHLILSRVEEIGVFEKSLRPPWPKGIMFEFSSICNHACEFCAYSKTTRPKVQANVSLMERIIQDAYELGSREIGLHSGTEPFTSPHLEHFTAFSKQVGYAYIYLSTNGSLATPNRLKACIDNGLSSIKFSVNAGRREVYRQVHGRDHFDRVINNIKFLSNYRRAQGIQVHIAVSFVEYERNRGEFATLRQILSEYVDEIVKIQAMNQSGQVPELPSIDKVSALSDGLDYPYQKAPCPLPFNRIHISSEGFLRACCNDYQNYLAVEDLHQVSLEEAFYSKRFVELRQMHLDDNLDGLLCQNCLYGCNAEPVQPLNPELATLAPENFFAIR